jgi:hypothetical protein
VGQVKVIAGISPYLPFQYAILPLLPTATNFSHDKRMKKVLKQDQIKTVILRISTTRGL